MEEITILIDFDRIPKEIGVCRDNGQRMYSREDLTQINTWISDKLPYTSPDSTVKIILLLVGSIPDWMGLGIGMKIESLADEIYYCQENSAIVRLK